MATGLRCSNPACTYQAHDDPQFGTFCCRLCHKHYVEQPGTSGHGGKCNKVPAGPECKGVDMQEPLRPMTKKKTRGMVINSPAQPQESNARLPGRPSACEQMPSRAPRVVDEGVEPTGKRQRLGERFVAERRAERAGAPRDDLQPQGQHLPGDFSAGVPPAFSLGMQVKARWTDGDDVYGKKWYNAVVLRVNRNGRYDLEYEDGSMKKDILEAQMKVNEDAPAGAGMSSTPSQPARPVQRVQQFSPTRPAADDEYSDYYSYSPGREPEEAVSNAEMPTDQMEYMPSAERSLHDLLRVFLLQRKCLSFLSRFEISGITKLSDLQHVKQNQLERMGMDQKKIHDIMQGISALFDDDSAVEEMENLLQMELNDPERDSEESRAEMDMVLPRANAVPEFSSDARGEPWDWNLPERVFQWSNCLRHCFPVSRGEVDVNQFVQFLRKRRCPDGRPASDLLGHPEELRPSWWRLKWLEFDQKKLPLRKRGLDNVMTRTNWMPAWHGTKIEAVFSTICWKKLFASSSEEAGHRFHPGYPGVYLYPEKKQACGCAQLVPLFRDGTFWAAVWEVRCNRVEAIDQGDPDDESWIQPDGSVQLEALWLCGRSCNQIPIGDEVLAFWNPNLEANPLQISTPRRGHAEMPIDGGRGGLYGQFVRDAEQLPRGGHKRIKRARV